jgi:hypothetical protein
VLAEPGRFHSVVSTTVDVVFDGGHRQRPALGSSGARQLLALPMIWEEGSQMLELIFREAGKERVVALRDGVVTLGSDASCDVVLAQEGVGPRHARVSTAATPPG